MSTEIDLYQAARDLRVVDVHLIGNESGWITAKILYDPAYGKAPALASAGYQWWIDHGTVGTNTLAFWGRGGSIQNHTYSLAQFLVPKETTVYRDNRAHDTTNTVFKMVPDGFACNHTGPCIDPIGNDNALGCEYESLQNGTHDITDRQYVKGALLYAYNAALHGFPDWRRLPHGIIALPYGRRSDPYAGKFDIARSWELVQAIRRDERIWQFWGLEQPQPE